MKVQIDFGQVQDFKAIPAGTYVARVMQVELKDGREHPQLLWKFMITEGTLEGQTAIMSTSFSPKALFKLKQIFEAFGLDAKATAELEIDEDSKYLINPDFTDQMVTLVIGKPREWEGREQTNITTVTPSGKVTVGAGEPKKGSSLK